MLGEDFHHGKLTKGAVLSMSRKPERIIVIHENNDNGHLKSSKLMPNFLLNLINPRGNFDLCKHQNCF